MQQTRRERMLCGGCGCSFPERQLERPAYGCSRWVGETWNTLSNLPFVVFGVWLCNGIEFNLALSSVSQSEREMLDKLWWLSLLYILAGVCSGIHHACAHIKGNRWSIYLDWTPIAASIVYILCDFKLLRLLYRAVTWWAVPNELLILLAAVTLISDHLCTPLPVPLGHCLWHVLAALAIGSVYGCAAYLSSDI